MFSLTMLLIPVGLGAGVLAGLFGIGGGLIIVPILTLLLIDQGQSAAIALPTAIATSLGSMLITSGGAVWSHAKKMPLDVYTLIRLGPGVMLGAWLGAWLATQLPTLWVGLFFVLIVSMIGLRMTLGANPSKATHDPNLRGVWWASPVMGASSALVGIGGGSLVVPYLIWNGYAPVKAVALASATGWLLALSGTLSFWMAPGDFLNGRYVMVIGLCGFVAAPLGVALAHRLSAARLGRLFGLMLVAVAFRMLWQIYTAS